MRCLRTTALAATCAFLAGCSAGGGGGNYAWGWYVLDPFHPKGGNNLAFLLSGAGATIGISVGALSVSVIAGALLAVAGLSGNRALRWLNRSYVEVFRAIPVLVLLLWIYYGLPTLLGIAFPVFWAGLVTLALSDAAFEAEIFRAGIQSVPRGQREAAATLGLSRWHAFRHIVLPQALRHIAPALGNQFVYVLKMSSLVSVIGFQELTRRANELNVTEYRPLEIYSFLVVEYLLLILVASWCVRRLEQRMAAAPH
jgi:His/Glu/Gln/Arg/opine family amino acid ABC transporter permease subunit